MISNDSAEPQASLSRAAESDAAEAPVAVLDPRSPIEVASGGTGTTNDPGGTDTRPPGIADPESCV